VPPRAEAPGQRFEGSELVAFWGVREGKRELGSVILRVTTEPLVLPPVALRRHHPARDDRARC
jgi:hypothetical protein